LRTLGCLHRSSLSPHAASPTADYGSRVLDFFTMFGRGEKKSLIAGADENGLIVMYDLAQRTVHNQVRLNE